MGLKKGKLGESHRDEKLHSPVYFWAGNEQKRRLAGEYYNHNET